MTTFIALVRYTEQGMRNIKQSPQRADAFAEAARGSGIAVKDIYWTAGEFDGVLIFEAPDDAVAASAMLRLGRSGNVKTRTLRAFDRSEMESILEHVG